MAGTSGLPLAGVEAIVEGLTSFQGDVRKMNSALDSIRPRSTMLQNAFSGAWEMVKGFGREVLNVAEYTLGHILADSLQWVIGKLGELASATIAAGSEFQTLELRLERLNFNTLIESGESLESAQTKAIQMTKEQLEWLQKLAATTPYDNTDISNTFTLARSYGFAADRAQGLTEDIINFAAGMGLGNTEIERIIINFGQMVQQGKVTQREMNDLARGSFVPVNDVLKRMRTNLGLTEDELTDFRKTAESVPAFMEAFSQVVDERFSGAAEKMAKTFKAASDNARDVVKSIGGMHVVKPILDAIGARVAAFVSAFTDDPQKWDRMVNAAKRLGSALTSVVEGVFGLLPSSEAIADRVVGVVESIADWVETHRADIIGFFVNIGKTIREEIIPWIQNTLVPALMEFGDWISDNKPTILEFFETVGKIVGDFFKTITSQPGKPEGEGGILESITKFMQFVIENQEAISKWVEVLWSVFIVWQVLSTIWNIAFTIAVSLGVAFLTLSAVFAGLSAVIGLVVPAVGGLLAALAPLIVVILAVIATIKFWQFTWEMLKGSIAIVWDTIKTVFTEMKETVINTFTEMVEKAKSGDWKGVVTSIIEGLKNNFNALWGSIPQTISRLFQNMIDAAKKTLGISSPSSVFMGIGKSLIDGLIAGIKNGVGSLIAAARNAALAAYNAARRALGIQSPSRMFFDIGEFTMQGFAQGIEKAAGMAVGAMQSVVGQVAVPAISSASAAMNAGNTYHNNTEFNLNMTSNAQREPLLQDFAMMASLVG